MARPKGSRNKPKLTVVGDDKPSPGIGHNGLSDEQQQSLHLNNHVPAYERALKAKKDADAQFKNVCKTIKSEGGTVVEVKRTIALRSPEGEARLKAEIEGMLRIARWNGLPVGTQSDLFGTDRRPVEERAFDDGKRAGLAGETCKPPHGAGTAAYDKWQEGWHVGQAVLATGFKKKEPDAPELLRPEGAAVAGAPDDFDQASDTGTPPSGDSDDDSEEVGADPVDSDDI